MPWTFEIIPCADADCSAACGFAISGKDENGVPVFYQCGWPSGSDRPTEFTSEAEARECLDTYILPVWGAQ